MSALNFNADPLPAHEEEQRAPDAAAACVTVFQSDGPRANKLITRSRDGTITKNGAVMGGRYIARTYQAPDAETFANIHRDVASDPRMVLSLGTFTGIEPDQVLRVLPAQELADQLGIEKGDATGIHEIDGHPIAARLRANMQPGGWILFDRDITPGMPAELAGLSCDQWLEAMCLLLPGLDRADRVLVPSTTGRVLVDGKPMEAAGWHLFVRVDDPEDMADRVWAQLLIKAHATTFRGVPLGFMKPLFARDGSGRIVGRTAWSIYDPTAVGCERLVYDGQPLIRGKGLKLAPPAIEVFPDEPWSTRSFADLDPEVEERIERKHGLRLERTGGNGTGRVRALSLVCETLSPDLEVETERGWKTIAELCEAGEKARCQSPFRDSESWAAYVNFHADGTPFLFDVGTRIKYVLPGYTTADGVEFDAARREPPPEGWRPPITPERPPYPLEALPAVLRDAVREYRQHGQQPTDLIATSALVAASVAAQGLIDVRRDRHLVGPASLFGLVMADSGERKSSADAVFVAPIREAERQLLDQMAEQIKDAKREFAVWQAKHEGLTARIKEKTKQGKLPEAAQAERDLEALGEAPEQPPEPYILHEDVTPEALARDLAKGWPSAGLWSAEGGAILSSWAMANEKASVRFGSMLNKLWSGEDYRSSRMTRERIFLQGRRLGCSIMVQPGVFAAWLASNGGAARATGLLARFLVCQPISTMGTRLYREPEDDGPALLRYAEALEDLLRRPLPLDADGGIAPPELGFTPAGKAVWVAFHDAVEAELPGDLEDVQDIASKIADQAARLAAIFHVLERGTGGEISEDEAVRAVEVASWHLVEMKRVLGLADVSADEKNGRDLLRFLQKKGEAVWIKDVTMYCPARAIRRSAKARDRAIDWLANRGLARKFQKQGRTYVEATHE